MATNRKFLILGAFFILIAGIGIFTLPAALPPSSSSAERIPFSLLAETTSDKDGNPIYPQELSAANGKRVALKGYVAPFSDPQNLSEFIITQSVSGDGCYFCIPPSLTGLVLVKHAGKEQISIGDVVTVEGTLHLKLPGHSEDQAQEFLFLIDDAHRVDTK